MQTSWMLTIVTEEFKLGLQKTSGQNGTRTRDLRLPRLAPPRTRATLPSFLLEYVEIQFHFRKKAFSCVTCTVYHKHISFRLLQFLQPPLRHKSFTLLFFLFFTVAQKCCRHFPRLIDFNGSL